MKNLQAIALVAIVFATACKKDDQGTENPNTSAQFNVPSTIGSWWVYDWYSIDTTGAETQTSLRDSVFIARDTLVRGQRYAVIEGTFLGQPGYKRTERDSMGFVVASDGTVHYSYNQFGTVIEEGNFWGFIRWKDQMHDSAMVTVSAGEFLSIEARRAHYHASGAPINTCGDSTFVFSTYYASGVGRIMEETAYFGSIQNCSSTLEARLSTYFIAPQ